MVFVASKNVGVKLARRSSRIGSRYAYARKPHYAADIVQALCWGMICGTEAKLPYWYVGFFLPMIIHRALRDDARCSAKYGADWARYTTRVPYVFVPGLV